MHSYANNGRSLGEIVSEMKVELREFIQTRFDMLKTELQERIKSLRIAVPLAGLGALLLGYGISVVHNGSRRLGSHFFP